VAVSNLTLNTVSIPSCLKGYACFVGHSAECNLINHFTTNRCALDDTVKFYDLKKNMAAFSLEAFRFNNQSMHYVYFQCDVVVCDVDDEDPLCKRNCSKVNETLLQKWHLF